MILINLKHPFNIKIYYKLIFIKKKKKDKDKYFYIRLIEINQ